MPVTQKFYPSEGDQLGKKEKSSKALIKRKTNSSFDGKMSKLSIKQKIIVVGRKIQNLFRMSW